MGRIKAWLRREAKYRFILYDISDLQIGANCGLCGAWIADRIVEVGWAWDICAKCLASAAPPPSRPQKIEKGLK